MQLNIANRERIGYSTEVIDGVTHITITEKIIVDNFDFEQRVKVVSLLMNKTQHEICKKLGMSQSNFLIRCQTGKFNFEEQRQIAEALGCKLVLKIVFDDGVECAADSAHRLIMEACSHAEITQTELGQRLGKSKQAFNQKLLNGKFTDLDLAEIANEIGCKYVNYFELEDGTRI